MAIPTEAEIDFLKSLGHRIRNIRHRRGMTRKQLADLSHISERYVAQFENGKGNISIILLRRVSEAMEIQIEDLTSAKVNDSR